MNSLKVGERTFSAIGNQWLLEHPIRLQVRCHNNKTPENLHLIAVQKEYFFARGREGGVLVSPCISAGEKEIARAALEEKLPLIVLLENGFLYEKLIFSYKKPFGVSHKQGDNVQLHFYAMI